MPVLRSPVSQERLHLESDKEGDLLVSAWGERFRIEDGIAQVLRPEDVTGSNGKYNRLYEVIGGMYDDVQRVACALSGIDRDAYAMSYLGQLEIKPGDTILETSVGTGLNFKYLPKGVHLVGLVLSRAMLAGCQLNLAGILRRTCFLEMRSISPSPTTASTWCFTWAGSTSLAIANERFAR